MNWQGQSRLEKSKDEHLQESKKKNSAKHFNNNFYIMDTAEVIFIIYLSLLY